MAVFNTSDSKSAYEAYCLYQEMDTFIDTAGYSTLLDYFIACNEESNGWVAEKVALLLDVPVEKAMEKLVFVEFMGEPPTVVNFSYTCSHPQAVYDRFFDF